MKVSTAVAILALPLVGASQFAQASDESHHEKRLEKSEMRIRTEGGEVRQRHRVKTENRADRDSRDGRSGRRDGEHGHRGAGRSGGSNRGPG